jgi:replicative DNA helicase
MAIDDEDNKEESNNNSHVLYNSFLINFTNIDFLSDFINISLYQSDMSNGSSGASEQEIFKFMTKFLRNLREDIRNSVNLDIETKQYINLTYTCEKIIKLKEDLTGININYDNVFNHFNKIDTTTKKIIMNVIKNRFFDNTVFRKKLDETIKTIQIYNRIKEVALPAIGQFGSLIAEANQGGTESTVWLKKFVDTLHGGYSNLSTLKELSKDDKLTDYMVFDNKESVNAVVDDLVGFLSSTFKRYKTGYPVIDESCSGGIESGSVSIISGPSNHAKSIYMINILRNVIEMNDWQENDAVLMITLEDDKFKLLSRVLSIFGKHSAKVIKDGYERTNQIMNKKPALAEHIKSFWKEELTEAIIDVTESKKCKLLLKHDNENSFSMADVNTFIDKLEMDGTNVKFVAIDYLDVMSSSHKGFNNGGSDGDYQLHGAICQEMRGLAKARGIPVLTISQNNRSSEGKDFDSNSDIGGSHKKVSYSDLLIMIQQLNSLDITNPTIGADYNMANLTNKQVPIDIIEDTIPFRATITKNKNGTKGMVKVHIFSTTNLRIYTDASQYIRDLNQCSKDSITMKNKLDNLEFSTMDSDLDNTLEFKELLT